MAIIKCTAKLLKDLGVKPANAAGESPGLFEWHANLLRLDRKKYVLFTNDQTLYSFLVRWTKMPKTEGLPERFRLGLFKNLMSEGLPEKQIEWLMRQHAQIEITKTNSRSVLGSMNDLAFQVKYMVYRNGRLDETELPEMTRQLNRTPMSAIERIFSIDELKHKLADADE